MIEEQKWLSSSILSLFNPKTTLLFHLHQWPAPDLRRFSWLPPSALAPSELIFSFSFSSNPLTTHFRYLFNWLNLYWVLGFSSNWSFLVILMLLCIDLDVIWCSGLGLMGMFFEVLIHFAMWLPEIYASSCNLLKKFCFVFIFGLSNWLIKKGISWFSQCMQ